MALSKNVTLDQFELKVDPDTGNVAWAFRQDIVTIMDDANLVSRSFQRSAMDINDPQVAPILTQATAGALAQLQVVQGQLTAAQAQLAILQGQLSQAAQQNAAGKAQLQNVTLELRTLQAQLAAPKS